MHSPRDLDPKFKNVEPTNKQLADAKDDDNPTKEDVVPQAPVPGAPVPGGAVTPVTAKVDPEDETFIVYRSPEGEVRMPTSEWDAYQKENGL